MLKNIDTFSLVGFVMINRNLEEVRNLKVVYQRIAVNLDKMLAHVLIHLNCRTIAFFY